MVVGSVVVTGSKADDKLELISSVEQPNKFKILIMKIIFMVHLNLLENKVIASASRNSKIYLKFSFIFEWVTHLTTITYLTVAYYIAQIFNLLIK